MTALTWLALSLIFGAFCSIPWWSERRHKPRVVGINAAETGNPTTQQVVEALDGCDCETCAYWREVIGLEYLFRAPSAGRAS
jgi:hypothetical protein